MQRSCCEDEESGGEFQRMHQRARKRNEMMIIDKILQWARERGYTAVYGSAEQVNEMLTDVPFADSEDGTVVVPFENDNRSSIGAIINALLPVFRFH